MPETDNLPIAQDRAIRLFKYLKALTELRSTPVRNIEKYEQVLWLYKIPKEKECFTAAWERNRADEEEIWLEIKKPNFRPYPPLPEKIKLWVLDKDLSQSSGSPSPLPQIPIPSSDANQEDSKVELEQVEKFLYLKDYPEISQLWQDYYEKKWLIWAKEDIRLRKVQEQYARLHSIYQQQKRSGEAYELLIGLGLLAWRTPSGQDIQRHLLVAQAMIEFEGTTGTLYVKPAAEGAKLKLEQDMLEASERPPSDEITGIEVIIKEIEENIWNIKVEDILKKWAYSVSDTGSYSYELAPLNDFSNNPKVTYAPALLLRKRTQRSLLRTYNEIVNQLESGVKVPKGIQKIAETVEDQPKDKEERDAQSREFQNIYFPLQSNDEQIEIIEKFQTSQGVLVQGPPGTGKSHTIVNLICHLLATGNRVLVTSQTPRALKVLKNMLPEEMKALCVSFLGNDADSLRELEYSVQGITGRQAIWKSDQNQNEINSHEKQLDELKREEAILRSQIRKTREKETYEHRICNGSYCGTAQSIAKLIASQHHQYCWLNAYIEGFSENDQISPLSNEEILELLSLSRELNAEQIAEVEKIFPEREQLPSLDDLIEAHEDERQNQSQFNTFADFQSSKTYLKLIKAMPAELEDLKVALKRLLDKRANFIKLNQPWISKAIEDIFAGMTQQWQELYDISEIQLEGLLEKAKQAENCKLILPSGYERYIITVDIKELINYLEKGGKIRKARFLCSQPVKQAWYIIKEARIDGRTCDNLELLKIAFVVLETDNKIDKLWEVWKDRVNKSQGSRPEQVGLILDLVKRLHEILSLNLLLREAKIECEKIEGLYQPNWQNVEEINRYYRCIEAVEAKRNLKKSQSLFNQTLHELKQWSTNPNVHPVVERIINNIDKRDLKGYQENLDKLGKLSDDRRLLERKRYLHDRLNMILPKLAQAIQSNPYSDDLKQLLSCFSEAWCWAQAKYWLNAFIDKSKESQISARHSEVENKIRKMVSYLASSLAWRYCLSRLSVNERQHLIAWTKAIKRIGKGTGKRAPIHREDARKHLEQCQRAIPAWIMPLYRVAETVEPQANIYDVVIIDEASQSSVDALFLLYLAKKIIVVGDDQQISPEEVGIPLGQVAYLQELHIKDFPHKGALGLESSFFDLTEIYFKGRIVLLEHFRCMPEIIQFSNQLCYSQRPLEPLRQYPPNRLDPIKTVHVKEGYREGKSGIARNIPEADAIVQKIYELCHDPKYKGKSMGVISLLGEYQASSIAGKLLEKIGPEEIESRNLICGDAYAFQGDERDVIFLSMVRGPDEKHSLTDQKATRRFNVAASRAKDQVWLFHTPTLNDFANPGDLRYRLLEYYLNPSVKALDSIRLNCESEFERDVYDMITAYGHRVIPQYEVAGYRIDMVVEGMQGRLAVECDGDRWHSETEQREHDMRRQRILERCGWYFWRIRGSEFYHDKVNAMEGLWKELESRKIYPNKASNERQKISNHQELIEKEKNINEDIEEYTVEIEMGETVPFMKEEVFEKDIDNEIIDSKRKENHFIKVHQTEDLKLFDDKDSTIIGSIQLYRDADLVFSVSHWKRVLLANIRIYIKTPNYSGPTKKGVALNINEIHEFIKIIHEVEATPPESEPIKIGSIRKDQVRSIIIQLLPLDKKTGVAKIDIREHIESPKYSGPTKKGFRLSLDNLSNFISLVEKQSKKLDQMQKSKA